MASSFKFEAIFVDSTIGLNYKQYLTGHMSADTVIEFYNKLIDLGCVNQQTKVFANHFLITVEDHTQNFATFLNRKALVLPMIVWR